MASIDLSTQAFHGKLNELFPPDHPNTPWLLRLMFIRDDVHFEFKSIHKDTDGVDDTWLRSYFLRRISVSLLEAKNVFSHQLRNYLAEQKATKPVDKTLAALAPHFDDAIKRVEDLTARLEGLRNAVGAHVRPDNAIKGAKGVAETVLGNHPMLEGSVHVLGPTEDTSYKELSAFASLFAWPEVSDDDTLKAAGLQLQEAVVGAARAVNYTIDALLLHHWIEIGVIKPPSPMGVKSLTDPDDYEQII